MAAEVLLIPLDDRPCTYGFPAALAAIGGISLAQPPREVMGNWQTGAQRPVLHRWLQQGLAEGAQHVLVGLDTWLYGGLISSRKSAETLPELRQRLQTLKAVHQSFPQARFHLFATLLRISNSDDDTEERPYWRQYGSKIYRYSHLQHYLEHHGHETELEKEFQALDRQIPGEILEDYRALRVRNFQLLLDALAYLQDGDFASLVIGYDDAGEYGWNVQERQKLQAHIQSNGLAEKVLVYPGADELACTLLARVLQPELLKVYALFDNPDHAHSVTRYEGIPLGQTLAFQARASGCQLVDRQEAEAVLVMHTPDQSQYDQFLERDLPPLKTKQDYTLLMEQIETQLATSKPVAVADVLYANGGDYRLLQHLAQAQLLLRLGGYSAWNTASNTLGMALAWLKLYTLGRRVRGSQLTFLLERYADDGLYQGHIRQQLCRHYTQTVLVSDCLEAIAAIKSHLANWKNLGNRAYGIGDVEVEGVRFPWQRFFEIEVQLSVKSGTGAPE